MMFRRRYLGGMLFLNGCILGVGMLTGCSDNGPINVSTRYGEGLKFSGLGPTFAWAPAPPADSARPLLGNAEFRQLVCTTIEKHLLAKGFSPSKSGVPDFWVDYRLAKREKTDSGVNPHGEVFEEGSLVLDVLDPQTGKLIWRGVAQARILLEAAPEVREKRLNTAVQMLMRQFPPKQ